MSKIFSLDSSDSLHKTYIVSLQQKFRHRKFLLLFVSIQMSAAEKN